MLLLLQMQQLLLQALVVGPLLTLHFVNIFAQQGTLGYLVEEEAEERTHPYPEPDTSLLKNKVNHKWCSGLFKT